MTNTRIEHEEDERGGESFRIIDNATNMAVGVVWAPENGPKGYPEWRVSKLPERQRRTVSSFGDALAFVTA